MAIELSQESAVAVESQQQQQDELKKQVQEEMNGHIDVNGNGNGNGNGHGQEGMGMGMDMGMESELELHRACAGGNLDEVRAVLSRGLDHLEVLDMNTGCTPIVLAIRANFPDVVRELLAAGAIVPPPGITNDPTMLSILYPQPMYPQHGHGHGHGIPPQFMGHPMAPEFYPQSGFYDQRQPMLPQHQHQQQQQQANLPPAEVAKTIPCRNFPQCKYGNSCVFLHPRGPAPAPGQFFPNGPAAGPGFQYEGYGGFQPMPYFNPQANGFQPQSQPSQIPEGEQQQQFTSDPSVSQTDAPLAQFNDQHSLSGAPAPFVPFGMTSPPPPQFISPMSPPMMNMPMSPQDAAFFAQSPPNGIPPPMNGNGNGTFAPRRLSVNQGPNGFPKFHGHGKKPSFSGGPRPWAPGSRNPAWKDGTPPSCVFFAQSKCRNGEFCKFPHLDQEGNDLRHPDIVRGVMAPAPSMARIQRPMRVGGFGFDPSRQFVPRSAMEEGGEQSQSTPVDVIAESTPAESQAESATETSAAATAPAAEIQEESSQVETKPVPAVNQANANANGNLNVNANAAIARSASQPGHQRFQQNGFHSRAQSPNAPFNQNGNGPRRAGRPFNANGHPMQQQQGQGQGQGVRSVSAGARANKQRIPNADEFPALGGMSGSTSPQEKSSAVFGKTAAQVLSAPAPPKPEVVKQESTSEDEVTMDDESDSDAVIITMNKPSEKTSTSASTSAESKPVTAAAESTSAPASAEKENKSTAAPAVASAPVAKPSTISFASVASAIKDISNGGGTSSIESAPVALKA